MHKRTYNLNENYFETINSQDKAYWYGFLYADGHNDEKYLFSLELQERDKNHLEKLALSMEANNPIKTTYHKTPNGEIKTYYQFKISRKKICDDLKKLGIGKDKTLNPQSPIIENQYYRSFLRGFIDGDGTVFIKRKTATRIATTVRILFHKNLEDFIRTVLKEICPECTFSISKHHRTEYLINFNFDGNQNAKCLLDALYKDANIYLKRKHDKYIELLEYFNRLNMKPSKESKYRSRYRGVFWESRSNKWGARISFNSKKISLGYFKEENEAALAYNLKAIELKKGRAILNKIN